MVLFWIIEFSVWTLFFDFLVDLSTLPCSSSFVRRCRHLTTIFYRRHHLPSVILQLLNSIFILLTAVSNLLITQPAVIRADLLQPHRLRACRLTCCCFVNIAVASSSLQPVDRHSPASYYTNCCCCQLLDPPYVGLQSHCSSRQPL